MSKHEECLRAMVCGRLHPNEKAARLKLAEFERLLDELQAGVRLTKEKSDAG